MQHLFPDFLIFVLFLITFFTLQSSKKKSEKDLFKNLHNEKME